MSARAHKAAGQPLGERMAAIEEALAHLPERFGIAIEAAITKAIAPLVARDDHEALATRVQNLEGVSAKSANLAEAFDRIRALEQHVAAEKAAGGARREAGKRVEEWARALMPYAFQLATFGLLGFLALRGGS